jgi:hypothetical protein
MALEGRASSAQDTLRLAVSMCQINTRVFHATALWRSWPQFAAASFADGIAARTPRRPEAPGGNRCRAFGLGGSAL